MFDPGDVRAEFTGAIEQLTFETNSLWRELLTNDWFGNNAHWPFAHYGYMMTIFSRIDLLSRYWAGRERNQTSRMVGFLDRYMHPEKTEENRVAVQLWRHTLMHTGDARRLQDTTTGKRYTWVIYFGPGLDPRPHYSIYYDHYDQLWVLVIVVTELVADLRHGQALYLEELTNKVGGLQANYQSQDPHIRLQAFRL